MYYVKDNITGIVIESSDHPNDFSKNMSQCTPPITNFSVFEDTWENISPVSPADIWLRIFKKSSDSKPKGFKGKGKKGNFYNYNQPAPTYVVDDSGVDIKK